MYAIRSYYVEHKDVEGLPANQLQGGFAVVSGLGAVSPQSQPFDQGVDEIALVVDAENPRGHA